MCPGVLETSSGEATPFPWSFTPQWLPWPTCGVSGPEQGCLGEAVMWRLWEVTLGEEGARTLQEMLLRPPGFSLAWGSGSPGAQRRDPKPPRKENHVYDLPFCTVAAAWLLSPVSAAALLSQASEVREP